MDYFYLFIISFLSATIFPFGSEALFLYDLSIDLNIFLLLLFATFGNTLGAVVNYWLGLKGERYIISKKLLDEAKLTKGKLFFDKYGGATLFFSWLPIFGDAFTFIAGILKYDRVRFVVIVAIAKFGRYLFLALGYYYFSS